MKHTIHTMFIIVVCLLVMSACDKEVIPSNPDNDTVADTISDPDRPEAVSDIYHSWFGKEPFDDGAYKTYRWSFDTTMNGHVRCEEFDADGSFKEIEVDEAFSFTYDEETKILVTSIYDEYRSPSGIEREYWTYKAEVVDRQLSLTDLSTNNTILLSLTTANE